MINSIKQIIKNYLNNESLTTLVYGTVVSISPIEIQIEKLIIPSSKIIIPSYFKTVNISLQINDKLILIKQQKGQLFYVLDKV